MLLGGISAIDLRSRLLAGELSPSDLVPLVFEAIGGDGLHAWACLDVEGLGPRAAAGNSPAGGYILPAT